MFFKLHYHCQNNGDGSASVKFHETNKDAEIADESQSEGWGESSANHVVLKIENDQIFYQSYDWENGGKNVWHLVEKK